MAAKNNWSEYQRLVMQRLDDLKSSQDKTNKFLFDHVESNNKDFETLRASDASIRKDIEVAAATHEAVASTKAKFWGLVGGVVSLAGGAVADYFMFRSH